MGNLFRILILILYFAFAFALNFEDAQISNTIPNIQAHKQNIEINISDNDSNYIAPNFSNSIISKLENIQSFGLSSLVCEKSILSNNKFKNDNKLSYNNTPFIPDSHLLNTINTRAP